MRFIDAFIGIILIGFLAGVFVNGLFAFHKLNLQYQSCLKTKNEQYFIGESFIKTCKGQGYKDLNQWQSNCREMFNLDYIAWSNAKDFMEVSMDKSNKELFYGVWEKEGIVKEVYCREKR